MCVWPHHLLLEMRIFSEAGDGVTLSQKWFLGAFLLDRAANLYATGIKKSGCSYKSFQQ
jgi:hypothetical protein